MALIEITADPGFFRPARKATVYLRANWADEWVEEANLYCDYLEWVASPSVSSAQLSWRFGFGLAQGDDHFDYHDIQDLLSLNPWVKITVEQAVGQPDLEWYGVATIDAEKRDGVSLRDEGLDHLTRYPTGEQTYTVYGLESLLDRIRITTAWVEDAELGAVELGRGLEFNRERQADKDGKHAVANRSASPPAAGEPYVFASILTDAADWSTRQIALHLAKYFPPKDYAGDVQVEMFIDSLYQDWLPDTDQPRLPTHGRTVKEVLDHLIDRRRLLGYVVEVWPQGQDGADAIVIRPFTYLDEAFQQDELIYPANDRQLWLDFDQAVDVDALVVLDATQHYHKITVRGARIVCCGSIHFEHGDCVQHWTFEAEELYSTGASNEAGYSALEIVAKELRNHQARQRHACERVFRYYGLPANWDATVWDDVAKEHVLLFPHVTLGVETNAHSVWWQPELRFARHLPLKTDHDYTGTKIQDAAIVDSTPEGHRWEYRATAVYVVVPPLPSALGHAPAEEPPTRWECIEKLAAAAIEFAGDGMGREFSCSVRVQDMAPGVVITPQNAEAHYLAGTRFSGLEVDAVYHDVCYDTLVITFAMEADYHLELSVGTAPAAGMPCRELVIDASRRDGDRQCALHYVAPGTVVDVIGGELKYTTTGGFVRDDREVMYRLASIARHWYSTPRQTMTLSWKYAGAAYKFRVGDLIAKIGRNESEQAVRTVITSIRIDFPQDENSTDRVTIRTQWAELDPMAMMF